MLGAASTSESGWDSYQLRETGTDGSGDQVQETVTGLESVTQQTTLNALSGDQTVTAGVYGDYTRSETVTETDGTSTVSQDTGTLQANEVADYNELTGASSVSESETGDRYSLLVEWTDASGDNTDVGGTVQRNLGGAAYTVGLDLAGSGQSGVQGNGSTAQVEGGGTAGLGMDDGGGRLGRLRTGGAGILEATGAANGGAEVLAETASLGAELYKKYCFAKGTPMETSMGWTPIEAIKPGDWVWSLDESDPHGEPVLKQVEEVFSDHACVLEVKVRGQGDPDDGGASDL